MSGITTPDDSTVVFQLIEPNATMLHVFALNFSFAVPKEVAEKFGRTSHNMASAPAPTR